MNENDKTVNSIAPDLWQELDKDQKDAEKVSRPSLTFWQDAKSRLVQNKVALISMFVIIFIVLACTFVPMLWPISYSDQVLDFANVPPKMNVYEITPGNYIYVTKENKALKVSPEGELLEMCKIKNDDKANRRYVYDFEGHELVVDYNIYITAKKEFLALEKKAKKDPSIDLAEAQHKLDVAKTFEVRLDGKVAEPNAKLRNKTYILGTDYLGRDLFIRTVNGGRTSLIVGFMAAILNFLIGVTYGGISGYFGGRLDNIMMRAVDILSSIPTLLYVILLMVVLESDGIMPVIVALAITNWLGMARIVRGQVLALKEQEFVLAAQSLGASTVRIMTKHLIPNIMGPVMVSVTMQVPSAIFTEAFLSFVGLGVSPPNASWGSLCNDALPGLFTYPYQLFFPALAISVTILAFNLFGDGLRDALDPKQRK